MLYLIICLPRDRFRKEAFVKPVRRACARQEIRTELLAPGRAQCGLAGLTIASHASCYHVTIVTSYHVTYIVTIVTSYQLLVY